MTKEQFKRACEIKDRLNNLNEIKREVFGAIEPRLSYAYKNSISDNAAHSRFAMRHIAKILDKHDKMIREEIDEEIRKLEEEIKIL